MGTITIEEYAAVGGLANHDAPIAVLNSLTSTTKDATTSTSAENITCTGNTKLVTIIAVEAHRVSAGANTTGDGGDYVTIPALGMRDFAVQPGSVLYYRADA